MLDIVVEYMIYFIKKVEEKVGGFVVIDLIVEVEEGWVMEVVKWVVNFVVFSVCMLGYIILEGEFNKLN